MRLAAVVDPADATLVSIEAAQPRVAFEATPVTNNESCRDPVGRFAALAGSRLDAGFARRVATEVGGPRGCSHLLTLAHLLGSTAAWALDRDRVLHGPSPLRRPGERVLQRDLVVDGHEPAPGHVQLAAQLTEVHLAPAPAVAAPMARFAAEVEVRVLLELELPGLAVTRIHAAERRRDATTLATAPWRQRTDDVAWLGGTSLGAGISARLLEHHAADEEDRPLLDVLLMLAPAMIQCAAALSEDWVLAARKNPSLVGIGGLPDSCWMWRRDGALIRARETEVAASQRSGSN
jgi:hypothetical protein